MFISASQAQVENDLTIEIVSKSKIISLNGKNNVLIKVSNKSIIDTSVSIAISSDDLETYIGENNDECGFPIDVQPAGKNVLLLEINLLGRNLSESCSVDFFFPADVNNEFSDIKFKAVPNNFKDINPTNNETILRIAKTRKVSKVPMFNLFGLLLTSVMLGIFGLRFQRIKNL